MRLTHAIPVIAILMLSAGGAIGQQSMINTSQLEELRGELSMTANSVRDNLSSTTQSIQALFDAGVPAEQQAVLQILDAMEVESRAILDQVKLNSAFMDELDRARAEVLVILRKQEREPSSPARDNRVARLESALAQVEDEYETLQGLESRITFSLSQHAQLRREIQLESGVIAVENFVGELGELTSNLERMVAVLDEVGASVLQTEETAVSQE
ncbi:hypothetical protein [Palleronia abyssalis]|uniref:Chromosome partition protein Smc n=1 Tax=Palleronia abyssalis TaxID=1501240 RepID=A0A2R8C193_9RHOB|nr:hypothetical protein [Palleronia abyssalis]SPJ26188.1 hypothetical protein PAA8504_04044 [Palleronia abyssalis]